MIHRSGLVIRRSPHVIRWSPLVILVAMATIATGCVRTGSSEAGAVPRPSPRVAPQAEVVDVSAIAAVPEQPGALRTELHVLVISDGESSTEAIAFQLDAEGVPFTKIDLTDPNRVRIDDRFLATEATADAPARAHFQAVVLPHPEIFGPGSAEMAALVAYERRYSIRQVDAFAVAGPSVGLSGPGSPDWFGGPLDGSTLTVTGAGLGGPFSYLRGPIPIEDNSAEFNEAFAYLANPLPDANFTVLIDGTIPGTQHRAPVVGVFDHDGRSELVITMATNSGQFHARAMAHGIVSWMTRGIHLGFYRNTFTVQIDDIFLATARWDTTQHCTPGENCPGRSDLPNIRMTGDDSSALVEWTRANRLRLDLAYNGGGHDKFGRDDPALDILVAAAGDFAWINHTMNHLYLGCIRDTSVVPWRCATKDGAVRWMDVDTIAKQFTANLAWAAKHAIPVDSPSEVITGEHSGLFLMPHQPSDNPNLAAALDKARITLLASDTSRDPLPRQIGKARTLPRWPMDLFHDVGTTAEELSEYNWRYTSKADGGSGFCEAENSTCIAPLTAPRDVVAYVVPATANLALRHILTNDPRPHYLHQNNFAEDRLAYPVLNEILDRYRATFGGSAPLDQPSYRASAERLDRSSAWAERAPDVVTAWMSDGVVHVESTDPTLVVPLTTPEGTTFGDGRDFGVSYAGSRSMWVAGGPATVRLPLAHT
jgi:hypothetical protein